MVVRGWRSEIRGPCKSEPPNNLQTGSLTTGYWVIKLFPPFSFPDQSCAARASLFVVVLLPRNGWDDGNTANRPPKCTKSTETGFSQRPTLTKPDSMALRATDIVLKTRGPILGFGFGFGGRVPSSLDIIVVSGLCWL